MMYADGQGVKKNKRIARQLIKRSAVYKKPVTRSVDFISD
ncbi:SEL1-like repeat protein [Snodgrassella sp. M0110]